MQTPTFKHLLELIESNYDLIIFDENLYNFMSNNENYRKSFDEGRIHNYYQTNRVIDDFEKSSAANLCGDVDFLLNFNVTGKQTRKYYKLPDPMMTSYIQLDVGRLNPLLPQIQHLMDLSFEAGLPKIWKVFHDNFLASHLKMMGIFRNNFDETRNTLDFTQILPIFVILLIGHGTGFFVLLIEIFYHDCASHIGYFWRRSKINKKIVIRRKRRIIQVKEK